MISLDEKRQDWEKFRDGNEFGHDTYFILSAFQLNLKIILHTIRIYDVIVANLEKKIDADFSNGEWLKIKHQMTLDLIGRLLSLIESILTLFHALSKGYDKVPEIMTFYENSLLNQILSDFIEKKHNMRKILGLPELEKLELTDDERKLLSCCFTQTGNYIQEILKKWAEFYENFRIIYGKSRHGLSYLTGLGKSVNNVDVANFEDSMIVAFDKVRHRTPKDIILIDPHDEKKNHTWFDITSWLKIKRPFFDLIGNTIKELDEFSSYVIGNHLLYAENCGEDYCPSIRVQGKITPMFYGNINVNKQILNEIIEKIFTNTHFVNSKISYQLLLDNEKMIQSMNEQIITNFRFGPDPTYRDGNYH